jgi:hypothetical protein
MEKILKEEIFYFHCQNCGNLFDGPIGKQCPNCKSMDVILLDEEQLKRLRLIKSKNKNNIKP